MEEEALKLELLAKTRELEKKLYDKTNNNPFHDETYDNHTSSDEEKVVESSSVDANDTQSYC